MCSRKATKLGWTGRILNFLNHNHRNTSGVRPSTRSGRDWNCCTTKPRADYFYYFPQFLSAHSLTHTQLTHSHGEEPRVGDKNKCSWWQPSDSGGTRRPAPTPPPPQLTQLGPKSCDAGPCRPPRCPLVEHSFGFLPGDRKPSAGAANRQRAPLRFHSGQNGILPFL